MNLLESKPTPIDKPALHDYTEMLTYDILEAAREAQTAHDGDYIDDVDVLLESEFGVADVKTKAWKTFPVIVRSVVQSEKINQGALVIGAGAGEVDGRFIVEIVIEGAYTWQKLKELRYYLVKDLYTALLHELTHAADHAYDNETAALGRPPYMAKDGTLDDAEYWNDPREIRAFLQEVVDEALARAETFVRTHRGDNFTRDQVLEYVYGGKMWKQTAEFMNERNRAKILKAVYTALVDAGWI